MDSCLSILLPMEENMSTMEKRYNSQKYFIFKIEEYFKNVHNTLQKMRSSSIRVLLMDCIDINEEINNGLGDTSKLEKAQENLYKCLLFELKHNPICKHKFIKEDIENLINCIVINNKQKNNGANEHSDELPFIQIKDKIAVWNYISSLLKKFKKINVLQLHIDLLKSSENKPLTFREVDKLVTSFVNELIYDGYSLKFLKQWYKSNIRKSKEYRSLSAINIVLLLDRFNNLDFKEKNFEVYISCWLPKDLGKEFVEKGTLEITYTFESHDILEEEPREENKFDHYYNLSTIIEACDEYKALEKVRACLDNYIDIYKRVSGFNPQKSVIKDVCYTMEVGNSQTFNNRRMEQIEEFKVEDNERDIEDIWDFISIRDELKRKKVASTDIVILERAFELINQAANSTKENKLLNLWSALEYILTYYPKNSIIEKVRQIIPKVITLYFIKDKMNLLWKRMMNYVEKNQYPNMQSYFVCNRLLNKCLINDDKYIKNAFAEFLSSDLATDLYTSFSEDILIQREVAELNGLLNQGETTKNMIKHVHDEIENDLNRIYRIRNKLVHSGNSINDNLDIITERLYRYLHSLMGTLIYHKKRNTDLTLTEVLYSLVMTYNWYIDFIEKSSENRKGDIASPKYLFI